MKGHTVVQVRIMTIRKVSDGTVFEIYLDDLKDDVKAKLVSFLGDNGNFDVIPLASIEREKEVLK